MNGMNGQYNGQYAGAPGVPQTNYVPVNVAGGVQQQQPGPQFNGQYAGQQQFGQWAPAQGLGNQGWQQTPMPQGQWWQGQTQGPPQQVQPQGPPPGAQTVPGLPGTYVFEGQTQPVQQQQQQQPQQPANPFAGVHAEVSRRTGIPVERVAAALNSPQSVGAVISQFLEEADAARQSGQQQQPAPGLPQQGPGQFDPWQTYDIPQQIMTTVLQRDPQTGWFKPIDPQYAHIAAQANHNVVVQQQRLAIMREDPAKLFEVDPKAKQVLERQVSALVEQRLASERLQQVTEQFKANHKADLWAVDPMTGQVMTDTGSGKPLLSPLGHAFQRHLLKLNRSGMGPSQELLDTSLSLAKMELGYQNQPQFPGQQQWGGQQQQQQQGWQNALLTPPGGYGPVPPQQANPWGGMPMSPPQFGAPQFPMQPPYGGGMPGAMGMNNPYAGMMQLAQMNQGWNTWTPNSVVRQTAAGEPLSFADSLRAELSTMPENLSGWEYLQSLDGGGAGGLQMGMPPNRMGGYMPNGYQYAS